MLSKKTKFSKIPLSEYSPKDLTIGFKDKKTLIFLDLIFYKNISETKELTGLESDLVNLFPNSRILIIALSETSDITGYSLLTNGEKQRTKCVTKGQIFLDYGELNEKELELHKQITAIINIQKKAKEKIDEHTKNMTTLDANKFHLVYRDSFLKKINSENKFGYLNGSLDNFVIENEFQKIMGCGCYDIEGLEMTQFQRRKLNFVKDSLKEYLYMAQNQ